MQNSEFEFILKGKAIVNDKITIAFKPNNNNVLLFQNWSYKTPELNKGDMSMFTLPADRFVSIVSQVKEYQPTCVFLNKDMVPYIFVVDKINFNQKENCIMLTVNSNKLLHSEIPPAATYENCRISLSTLPYHFIDQNQILSYKGIPFGKGKEITGVFDDRKYKKTPFYSFIYKDSGVFNTNNDVLTIDVKNVASLIAYEQWDINSVMTKEKRDAKCVHFFDLIKNVEDYNEKYGKENEGYLFTPTVSLIINNKEYLGVITDMYFLEDSDKKINLQELLMYKSIKDKENLRITIDLKRVKDHLGNYSQLNLTNLSLQFYMNIDDIPVVEEPPVEEETSPVEEETSPVEEETPVESFLPDNVPFDYTIYPNVVDVDYIVSNKNDNTMTIEIDQTLVLPDIKGNYLNTITGTTQDKGFKSKGDESSKTTIINRGKIVILPFDKKNKGEVYSTPEGQKRAAMVIDDNIEFINVGLIEIKTNSFDGDNFLDLRTTDPTIIPIESVIATPNGGNLKNGNFTQDDNYRFTGLILVDEFHVKTERNFTIIENLFNKGQIRFKGLFNHSQIGSLKDQNAVSCIRFLKNTKDYVEGLMQRYPWSGEEWSDIYSFNYNYEQRSDPYIITKPSGYVDIYRIQGLGENTITAGIQKCIYNNVDCKIMINNVVSGGSPKTNDINENLNYNLDWSLQGGNSSTYGIIHMGDISTTEYDESELTGELALFSKYELATKEFLDEEIDIINNEDNSLLRAGKFQKLYKSNKISQVKNVVGNLGIVGIHTVMNWNKHENLLSTNVVCGIKTLIQNTYVKDGFVNRGATIIENVKNYGYGGPIACMGIDTVVYNMSMIAINYILNKSPSNLNPLATKNQAIGIKNVIQNGYSKMGDASRMNLPPFPPEGFGPSGPMIITYDKYNRPLTEAPYDPPSNELTSKFTFKFRAIWDDYVNSDFSVEKPKQLIRNINHVYNQGQISIHVVNNIGHSGSLAIGVDRYGGYTFDPSIMDLNTKVSNISPIDTTYYIFNYVKFNVNNSIVWSFPKKSNSSLDSFLMKDKTEVELFESGWHWTQTNPVQMYYLYKGSDAVSNTVHFPMNWGILSIDFVNSGSSRYDQVVFNKGGSAYGTKKLISSLGQIQILSLTSSNEQKLKDDVKTEKHIMHNTTRNPEITRLLLNDDEAEKIDLPISNVKYDQVTEIAGVEVKNLDVEILSIHSYADKQDMANNNIRGFWTNGTEGSVNHKFPYMLLPSNLIKMNTHVLPIDSDFRKEFDEKTSLFGRSKKNVLDDLISPGASYGVYRTIDYGCEAPGLGMLISYTQPMQITTNEGEIIKNTTPMEDTNYRERNIFYRLLNFDPTFIEYINLVTTFYKGLGKRNDIVSKGGVLDEDEMKKNLEELLRARDAQKRQKKIKDAVKNYGHVSKFPCFDEDMVDTWFEQFSALRENGDWRDAILGERSIVKKCVDKQNFKFLKLAYKMGMQCKNPDNMLDFVSFSNGEMLPQNNYNGGGSETVTLQRGFDEYFSADSLLPSYRFKYYLQSHNKGRTDTCKKYNASNSPRDCNNNFVMEKIWRYLISDYPDGPQLKNNKDPYWEYINYESLRSQFAKVIDNEDVNIFLSDDEWQSLLYLKDDRYEFFTQFQEMQKKYMYKYLPYTEGVTDEQNDFINSNILSEKLAGRVIQSPRIVCSDMARYLLNVGICKPDEMDENQESNMIGYYDRTTSFPHIADDEGKSIIHKDGINFYPAVTMQGSFINKRTGEQVNGSLEEGGSVEEGFMFDGYSESKKVRKFEDIMGSNTFYTYDTPATYVYPPSFIWEPIDLYLDERDNYCMYGRIDGEEIAYCKKYYKYPTEEQGGLVDLMIPWNGKKYYPRREGRPGFWSWGNAYGYVKNNRPLRNYLAYGQTPVYPPPYENIFNSFIEVKQLSGDGPPPEPEHQNVEVGIPKISDRFSIRDEEVEEIKISAPLFKDQSYSPTNTLSTKLPYFIGEKTYGKVILTNIDADFGGNDEGIYGPLRPTVACYGGVENNVTATNENESNDYKFPSDYRAVHNFKPYAYTPTLPAAFNPQFIEANIFSSMSSILEDYNSEQNDEDKFKWVPHSQGIFTPLSDFNMLEQSAMYNHKKDEVWWRWSDTFKTNVNEYAQRVLCGREDIDNDQLPSDSFSVSRGNQVIESPYIIKNYRQKGRYFVRQNEYPSEDRVYDIYFTDTKENKLNNPPFTVKSVDDMRLHLNGGHKYKTGNVYYGFTHELKNLHSHQLYNTYYMIDGPYSIYKAFQKMSVLKGAASLDELKKIEKSVFEQLFKYRSELYEERRNKLKNLITDTIFKAFNIAVTILIIF